MHNQLRTLIHITAVARLKFVVLGLYDLFTPLSMYSVSPVWLKYLPMPLTTGFLKQNGWQNLPLLWYSLSYKASYI